MPERKICPVMLYLVETPPIYVNWQVTMPEHDPSPEASAKRIFMIYSDAYGSPVTTLEELRDLPERMRRPDAPFHRGAAAKNLFPGDPPSGWNDYYIGVLAGNTTRSVAWIENGLSMRGRNGAGLLVTVAAAYEGPNKDYKSIKPAIERAALITGFSGGVFKEGSKELPIGACPVASAFAMALGKEVPKGGDQVKSMERARKAAAYGLRLIGLDLPATDDQTLSVAAKKCRAPYMAARRNGDEERAARAFAVEKACQAASGLKWANQGAQVRARKTAEALVPVLTPSELEELYEELIK